MNPSILNVYMFYMKILGIFIHINWNLNENNAYTYFVFFHLIKACILYYFAIEKLLYHQKNVSKTNGILASSYLWINLIFVIL